MRKTFSYTREIIILDPSKLEFRQKKSTLFFNQRKKLKKISPMKEKWSSRREQLYWQKGEPSLQCMDHIGWEHDSFESNKLKPET